jgi:hypothetical protein
MALANLYRVVQDLSGNVVPEVLGTVMLSGTSTLATLFSDAAGTAPLPNPLVNNPTYGSFSVFVGAGIYDMSFVKSGYTFQTQYNIALRDPAAGVNVLSGTPNQVILTPPTGVGNVTLSLPQSIAPDSSVQFAHLGLGTPATGDALVVSGVSTFTGTLNANAVAITGGYARLTDVAVITDADSTAYYTNRNAGGNRYAVYGAGTAPSYFGGTVQVGGDVTLNAKLNLGAGVPVTNYKLAINWAHASDYGLVFRPNDIDTGAGWPVMFFSAGGGNIGSISTSGSATAYNTSSDARLKHAVTTLTGALERVRTLRPVSFRWNTDDSAGVGYLAHELMTVIPEAVTGVPDAVDAQGQIVPQQVDHSKLVPWLTAAVQALLARVEVLEGHVSALHAQLTP